MARLLANLGVHESGARSVGRRGASASTVKSDRPNGNSRKLPRSHFFRRALCVGRVAGVLFDRRDGRRSERGSDTTQKRKEIMDGHLRRLDPEVVLSAVEERSALLARGRERSRGAVERMGRGARRQRCRHQLGSPGGCGGFHCDSQSVGYGTEAVAPPGQRRQYGGVLHDAAGRALRGKEFQIRRAR